ncbi:adenine deaminase [Heliobacterium chlorum]|uniref:Adenine deaminase n=1 Tax=Heliobacterium chlorum TaxID=2698 RepID=A0ABR7T5A0_HELCL|nr:adenine deaminase [Heliobacterium chlorum]
MRTVKKPVKNLIAVANGERPADLVLKNAEIFNVFTGEFERGDIALVGGYIAGVGDYSGEVEYDCSGRYVTPGFIDGHVHIESSMVSPSEFARAVVPLGTTTVIADPHEIANVAGREGIRFMLDSSEQVPLNVYLMLPSAVPATTLETSGATLNASDLAEFLDHPRVLGLGEMMNFPGLLSRDEQVVAKLEMVGERVIDGHGPTLTGKALNAYIAAGVRSDHECTTAAEASERLSKGMVMMLREGSAAKNLLDLLPAVKPTTSRRCIMVTDDRHPDDLIQSGHINQMVKMTVDAGIDIATAIQMATINTATYFRLHDLGAVAPGYRADLLVFDDLMNWKPQAVFRAGKKVAEKGRPLFERMLVSGTPVHRSLHIGDLTSEDLQVPARSKMARVIELAPRQIFTRERIMTVPVRDGRFVAAPEENLLKLAVIERHKQTGNVGVGFVYGLGLRVGAIASTVAHDSHNLVVAGATDADMLLALEEIERNEGGLAIVADGRVLGSLPLPLGGLMSEGDIYEVQTKLNELLHIARQLGVHREYDPFLTLAFLSLPVIPELKLTDKGLVDVRQMQLVPVSL